jgi:hypothetical protein
MLGAYTARAGHHEPITDSKAHSVANQNAGNDRVAAERLVRVYNVVDRQCAPGDSSD